MKELKLKSLKFGATEALSRAKMKNVMGGYGGSCNSCDGSKTPYKIICNNGEHLLSPGQDPYSIPGCDPVSSPASILCCM